MLRAVMSRVMAWTSFSNSKKTLHYRSFMGSTSVKNPSAETEYEQVSAV